MYVRKTHFKGVFVYFTLLAFILIVLTLKSTPIVAACSGSNASSVNLRSKEDFPTPLSPIINSFNVVKIESPSIFDISNSNNQALVYGCQ